MKHRSVHNDQDDKNIHFTGIEKSYEGAGDKIADIPLLTTLKIIEYNISVDQEVWIEVTLNFFIASISPESLLRHLRTTP
jgi:hypothetical protein